MIPPNQNQVDIRAFADKFNDKVREKIKEAHDTEKVRIMLDELEIRRIA